MTPPAGESWSRELARTVSGAQEHLQPVTPSGPQKAQRAQLTSNSPFSRARSVDLAHSVCGLTAVAPTAVLPRPGGCCLLRRGADLRVPLMGRLGGGGELGRAEGAFSGGAGGALVDIEGAFW